MIENLQHDQLAQFAHEEGCISADFLTQIKEPLANENFILPSVRCLFSPAITRAKNPSCVAIALLAEGTRLVRALHFFLAECKLNAFLTSLDSQDLDFLRGIRAMSSDFSEYPLSVRSWYRQVELQRVQIRIDPNSRFVSWTDYCKLLVSNLQLQRSNHLSARLVCLNEPATGISYFIEFEKIEVCR